MDKSLNNKWLDSWMPSRDILLWGAADIRALCFCIGEDPEPYPGAISWAIPMSPDIMAGLKNGPTQAYAKAYAKVNKQITGIASSLSKAIVQKEFRAYPLAASDRTDLANIRGDFPHKTAATLSGSGVGGPPLSAGNPPIRTLGTSGYGLYGHAPGFWNTYQARILRYLSRMCRCLSRGRFNREILETRHQKRGNTGCCGL